MDINLILQRQKLLLFKQIAGTLNTGLDLSAQVKSGLMDHEQDFFQGHEVQEGQEPTVFTH